MTIATTESTITEHEAAQVERANASSATPVIFVHGLWLLPSSWAHWVSLFEEAGYVGLTPGWPEDPETVAEAREHPEVFAGKGIGEIADYEEAIIRRLDRKPVIIGHRAFRPGASCDRCVDMADSGPAHREIYSGNTLNQSLDHLSLPGAVNRNSRTVLSAIVSQNSTQSCLS
jgi:hypothetical protein